MEQHSVRKRDIKTYNWDFAFILKLDVALKS